MTTHLVLVLALDGGTPAEVRAYGEQVAASIRRAARRGGTATIEWQAHQLADVHLRDGEPVPARPDVEQAGVGQLNAMTNDAGEWFYPDDPDDAAEFAEHHGARFVHPDGPGWS